MKQLTALLLASLLLVLTGCPRIGALVADTGLLTASGHASLTGQIRFQTQATPSEISSGATVSLIDTRDGRSVASTVTKANGDFSLSIANWTPQVDTPYALEAVRGLPAGGAPNRVGAAAARLRTLIRFNGAWSSLSTGRIDINPTTTALSILQSLKGLSKAQQLAMMGTANGASFTGTVGATGITGAEFTSVLGLVNAALQLNQDPLRAIARDVNTGGYVRLERGPMVTDISTTGANRGDTVVLYGSGFDPAVNIVRFNGVQAPAIVNATATQLTVTVPATAVKGALTVQVGNLVSLVLPTFNVLGLGITSQSLVTKFGGLKDPIPGMPATQWSLTKPNGVALDGNGNLYFTDFGANRVFKVDASGTLTLLAGTGLPGSDNGVAATARISNPTGIRVDGAGNLYVVAKGSYEIRKIGTNGMIAPLTTGALNGPEDAARDAAGNLYISDYWNYRIRKVDTAGNASNLAGGNGAAFFGDDGPAGDSKINGPSGIAVDASGSVFFGDGNNFRLRMVAGWTGTCYGKNVVAGNIYTVAGGGATAPAEGVTALSANLPPPRGVAVSPAGDVYFVTMTSNKIFRLDLAGVLHLVAGGGAQAPADGLDPLQANFKSIQKVAVDAAGNLAFVEDGLNQVMVIPKTSGSHFGKAMTAGKLYTAAGNGLAGVSSDGTVAGNTQLLGVEAIAIERSGALLFTDGNRLRRLSGGVVSTVTGSDTAGPGGNNVVAASGLLNSPKGVAVDASGSIFISDQSNYRIRMIPSESGMAFGQTRTAGNISTIVGGSWGSGPFGGDPLVAKLYGPRGMVVDAAGNLLFADSGNLVLMLPRVGGNYYGQTLEANKLYIIAGKGISGYSGDDGPAVNATINWPSDVVLDKEQNLYFSDLNNRRIRRVDRVTGIITTVAGGGAGFSDGIPALTANIGYPAGLAFDPLGNLYLSDTDFHLIRKVDPNGIIWTLGGAGASYQGDGGILGNARFYRATDIASDASGSLYIADTNNRLIRKVDP
ncbi:IPT/TIG domain-containing protein [bacterium]|nr:IPT/TIG domain-containing protein [bacterium]